MKTFIVSGFDHIEKRHDMHALTDSFVFYGPDTMQVSDSFHTMDEVYEHRIALFIALCRLIEKGGDFRAFSWRSKKHHPEDSGMYDGWFVLGVSFRRLEIEDDKEMQISYHLPLSRWEETNFAITYDHAPKWDGHSPEDV